MNGIVKRKKTANYAQIHNDALQKLEDIRTIGLISHLLSLPEDWEIRKTQLYSKFGRGPITNAIKELEAKGYWIDIKYRDGKKNYHYYAVSDAPFNDTEVITLIREVIDAGHKIMAVSATYAHLVSTAENQQFKNETVDLEDTVLPPSSVDSEQLMVKGSHSTVENEQQQSTYNKVNKDKENSDKDIVNINKEDNLKREEMTKTLYREKSSFFPFQQHDNSEFMNQLIETCHHYYNEFAIGRWSKKAWNTLVQAFASETVNEGRHVNIPLSNVSSYVYQALKNISYKHDLKNKKIEPRMYMGWLSE